MRPPLSWMEVLKHHGPGDGLFRLYTLPTQAYDLAEFLQTRKSQTGKRRCFLWSVDSTIAWTFWMISNKMLIERVLFRKALTGLNLPFNRDTSISREVIWIGEVVLMTRLQRISTPTRALEPVQILNAQILSARRHRHGHGLGNLQAAAAAASSTSTTCKLRLVNARHRALVVPYS